MVLRAMPSRVGAGIGSPCCPCPLYLFRPSAEDADVPTACRVAVAVSPPEQGPSALQTPVQVRHSTAVGRCSGGESFIAQSKKLHISWFSHLKTGPEIPSLSLGLFQMTSYSKYLMTYLLFWVSVFVLVKQLNLGVPRSACSQTAP